MEVGNGVIVDDGVGVIAGDGVGVADGEGVSVAVGLIIVAVGSDAGEGVTAQAASNARMMMYIPRWLFLTFIFRDRVKSIPIKLWLPKPQTQITLSWSYVCELS